MLKEIFYRYQGRSYGVPVAHATMVCCRYIALMFPEQALGATTEITKELLRSLIGRFLRELPPIYGARWLLAWQNNADYC